MLDDFIPDDDTILPAWIATESYQMIRILQSKLVAGELSDTDIDNVCQIARTEVLSSTRVRALTILWYIVDPRFIDSIYSIFIDCTFDANRLVRLYAIRGLTRYANKNSVRRLEEMLISTDSLEVSHIHTALNDINNAMRNPKIGSTQPHDG